MRFCEIVGQEEIKQALRLSVQEGRIPHAQLFYGPSGIGKLQLAIAYAQYIACPNRTETDSCGTCPQCLQFQKLQHPDLHFAFPIYKEKPGRDSVCDDFIERFRDILLTKGYFDINEWYAHIEAANKQGVIYEAESSEILRKLSLKGFYDGYKTMIIWLPEKMNVSCANKLLKILEEPPTQTLFLLVSEEPTTLLPTIISRTQQLKVPRLQEQEILKALQERQNASVEEATDAAHLAEGSYLKGVQHLHQNADFIENFNHFTFLMRKAWLVGHKKDYAALQELRQWSENMAAQSRENQKNFFQYAQRQVRENYIYNLHQPALNLQTKAEGDFSVKFAPFINENNVEKLMEQFSLAQRQIEQNGNAKIIFFDLFLQIIVLMK